MQRPQEYTAAVVMIPSYSKTWKQEGLGGKKKRSSGVGGDRRGHGMIRFIMQCMHVCNCQ